MRRKLERNETVLVADFGGGTSDFSVLRFSRKGGALEAQPLAHSGVGIAGDTFDYRIIDNVVAPRLGKGSFLSAPSRSGCRSRRISMRPSPSGINCPG